MSLPRCLAPAVLAVLVAGAAHAADWRAVPGAPDLQVDVASLQQERTRVTAWLRWWGRPAWVPELASWNARGARIHRTALRTEFDCSRRTLRVLAAHAYDGSGAPLLMSSVPGPVLPVQEAELAWAYDAVCEAARAGGRL
ncbi:hypothetical protein H8N03_12720 [Ramlibacter sp. USB13]|uniref:Lipoprotein n=1 Tax=Ramlibacter cellulosilyticus TaxID=2764187 RepID=A0A923MRY0_9BURK|nr:hypothetical protein [Ramlibacter cellulosilyticus]MBC5783811.1 hypothetical protein [Ramlibacter cellulosilyticus]